MKNTTSETIGATPRRQITRVFDIPYTVQTGIDCFNSRLDWYSGHVPACDNLGSALSCQHFWVYDQLMILTYVSYQNRSQNKWHTAPSTARCTLNWPAARLFSWHLRPLLSRNMRIVRLLIFLHANDVYYSLCVCDSRLRSGIRRRKQTHYYYTVHPAATALAFVGGGRNSVAIQLLLVALLLLFSHSIIATNASRSHRTGPTHPGVEYYLTGKT